MTSKPSAPLGGDNLPASGIKPATLGSDGPTTATEKCEDVVPTSKLLLAMVEDQGRKCALTGVELTPDTVELDHITPVAEGGRDVMSNCRAIHKVVNRMKGSLSDVEFKAWCRLVVHA